MAHSNLLTLRALDAAGGRDLGAGAEFLTAAIEFTKPRPSWWRREQIQRVKRRAEKRWPA
ncbi:MAG TPA: hypothetical protein VLL08_04220 [Kineosporiaceae bacterium]|nr:hypothetical protein [Kineosporiaceae bacterium]